jgi:hypothetical protein
MEKEVDRRGEREGVRAGDGCGRGGEGRGVSGIKRLPSRRRVYRGVIQTRRVHGAEGIVQRVLP